MRSTVSDDIQLAQVGGRGPLWRPLIITIPVQAAVWSPAHAFMKCITGARGEEAWSGVPLLDIQAVVLPDGSNQILPLVPLAQDLRPARFIIPAIPEQGEDIEFFAQRSVLSIRGPWLLTCSQHINRNLKHFQDKNVLQRLDQLAAGGGYCDRENASLLWDRLYERVFINPTPSIHPFLVNLGIAGLFRFASDHLPEGSKVYVRDLVINHRSEPRLVYPPVNDHDPVFVFARVISGKETAGVEVTAVMPGPEEYDSKVQVLEQCFRNHGNLADHYLYQRISCYPVDSAILTSRYEPIREVMDSSKIFKGSLGNGQVLVAPSGTFLELEVPPGAVVVVLVGATPGEGSEEQDAIPPQFDWTKLAEAEAQSMEEDEESGEEEDLGSPRMILRAGVPSASDWPWYYMHVLAKERGLLDSLFFEYLETMINLQCAVVSPLGPQLITRCEVDGDQGRIVSTCTGDQRHQDSPGSSGQSDQQGAGGEQAQKETLGDLIIPQTGGCLRIPLYRVGGREQLPLSDVQESMVTSFRDGAQADNTSAVVYASNVATKLGKAKEALQVTVWLANLFALEELVKTAEESFKAKWKPFHTLWSSVRGQGAGPISMGTIDAHPDLVKLFGYYKGMKAKQMTTHGPPSQPNEADLLGGFTSWVEAGSAVNNNHKPLRYRVLSQEDPDWTRNLTGDVHHDSGVLVIRENFFLGENCELLVTLLLPEAYKAPWAVADPHSAVASYLLERKGRSDSANMGEVLSLLSPVGEGREPRWKALLTVFIQAARVAGAQVQVMQHLLKVCGCLPLSNFPTALAARLLGDAIRWEETFKKMMPSFVGRTTQLPFYPIDVKHPPSCIRCGHRSTIQNQDTDLEEEEEFFPMCRVCQGHICERCAVDGGFYGSLDADTLSLLSPGPVDVLTLQSSLQFVPGVCAPCLFSYVWNGTRDLLLAKSVLAKCKSDKEEQENGGEGEMNGQPEDEPLQPSSRPTPMTALVKMYGPAPDLACTCINCGKHSSHQSSQKCCCTWKFQAPKGACLSKAVVCKDCFGKIKRQYGTELMLVCPPCQVLVKLGQKQDSFIPVVPIGELRFEFLCSEAAKVYGYSREGSGGFGTCQQRKRIYINQNRVWDGRLEDYEDKADEVFEAAVGRMVGGGSKSHQLPTRPAWAFMVKSVNDQLLAAGMWASREAYRRLVIEKLRKATQATKEHEKLETFHKIYNICRRPSCAMLGISNSRGCNITLRPSLYFKVKQEHTN